MDETGTYRDELPQTPGEPQETGTFLDELPDSMRAGLTPENSRDVIRQLRLSGARQQLEGKEETRRSWLARRSVPVYSSILGMRQSQEYGNAKKRIESNAASPEDYHTVAGYEKVQQEDAAHQGTLGGLLTDVGFRLPALLGEAAAGGTALRGLGMAKTAIPIFSRAGLARNAATTALMPSLYAEQFARGNVQAGRDPLDPRGFPAAYALGMLQNALLGKAGEIGSKAGGGLLGRLGASAGTGLVGQAGADVASTTISKVLPYAEAMDTRYGTLGALFRGEGGEAGRHAAAQAILFGAFGVLHGKEPQQALQEATDHLNASAGQGLSVGKAADNFGKEVLEPLAKGPEPAPAPAGPAQEVPPEMTPAQLRAEANKLMFGNGKEEPRQLPPSTLEQTAEEVGKSPEELRNEARKLMGLGPEIANQELPPFPHEEAEQPAPPTTPARPPVPPQPTEQPTEQPTAQAESAKPVEGQPESAQSELAAKLAALKPRTRKMLEQRASGLSDPEIARLHGVSKQRVGQIWKAELGGILSPAEAQKLLGQGEAKEGQIEPRKITKASGAQVEVVAPAEVTRAKRAHDEAQRLLDEHLDAIETGKEPSAAVDPLAAAKAASQREAEIARIEEQVRSLAEKAVREQKRGTLSKARQAEFQAEFDRLNQELAQRMPVAAAAAPAVPPEAAAPEGRGPGGQPAEGVKPATAEETARAELEKGPSARGLFEGEAGAVDLDRISAWASQTAGSLWRSGEARGKEWLAQMKNLGTHLANGVRKLAGAIAPRTTRLSRKLGEALGLVHAADEYVNRAVPDFVGRILGKKATEQQAQEWGEALMEERQRHGRLEMDRRGNAAAQAGDADGARKWSQLARDVETSIGKPHSSLKDEAAYQRVVKSPEYQAMKQRWAKELTPLLDQWYKLAEGMDLADPIPNVTQLPDVPFHARRYNEGEPLPEGGTFTSARGRLQNLKQQRISAAHPATLAGERYVTDLRDMIRDSIQERYKTAMKANALRTAVQEGYGRFGVPGQAGALQGHKEAELPFVSPPRGTQEAVPGVPQQFKQKSFYAAEPVYQDFRDAWQVDQPMKAIPGTGVFNLAALASSAEAVYHSKNLLTMLMKPGMLNPGRLWGNLVGRLQQSPQTMAKLLEIARIGAAKPQAKKPGLLWGGKTDPTAWMGKGLELLGDVIRLTAHDAFDEMVRHGLTPDTITNRRNFINQTGQYLKAAQPKFIQFLRDTQLGPFATAASNYWMQGLRALTGNPGLKPASVSAAVKLRAWTYGKMAAVLATGFTLNYLLHGRADGDDKTPFGAVKAYDDRGHTVYFDLTAFTGLTRGLRQTGILAAVEGNRAERPGGKSADRAAEDVAHNLLHPLMGPPVQFLHTALTGKNSLGMDIAPRAPVGGSQARQNVQTALANSNPVFGALTGAGRPPNAQEGVLSRGVKLLGPYGFKEKVREPVVGTYYDRLRDLEEHRRQSPERRAGKRFPQEQEFQLLERFRGKMDQLSAALKGERQVNGRTLQGPKPNPASESRLRALQADLARRALAAAGK